MENLTDDIKTAPGIDHFSNPARICKLLAEKIPKLRILEIGTGYGGQLKYFAPLCERVVCVDVMYDWVPDVAECDGFDESLVDDEKVSAWKNETKEFSDKVELIIGNTFHVHSDERHVDKLSGGFDVIIVDGCHHPAGAVISDYENYAKFMAEQHYVIFDDVNQRDPKVAAEHVFQTLENAGCTVESVVLDNKARVLFVS